MQRWQEKRKFFTHKRLCCSSLLLALVGLEVVAEADEDVGYVDDAPEAVEDIAGVMTDGVDAGFELRKMSSSRRFSFVISFSAFLSRGESRTDSGVP